MFVNEATDSIYRWAVVGIWVGVVGVLYFLRMFGNGVVAGCGVVRIGKRRYACGESMMIVRAAEWARGVEVVMIGPAGRTVIWFRSRENREFVELWQRWNHLDPKPELLE